jgi:phospholipase/lecithinase/hemolysin
MPASINISRLVVLGDSLSDRGTFDKRKLFGFIPLGDFYEVGFDAPRGRFTNGFVWGDYFVTAIIEQFEIDAARKKLKIAHSTVGNADVSDAIITNDLQLLRKNEQAFNLNDDKHILFQGTLFARFYCEAGLTSYDYKTKLTLNPKDEVLRLLVATLDEKRKLLRDDDKKYKICAQQKAETLIVEWSGANDLLTVNAEPSFTEAENAVNARIANLESLIHQGYRNFVLLNLPDLSLTPRFQAKNKEQQEQVAKCSTYFNQLLALKVQKTHDKYQGLKTPLNLSIFDIESQLAEIYNNCEQYEFDKNKLKAPYIDSDEFKKNQKDPVMQEAQISPAPGYMFWDDIHPIMLLHTWLAINFKLVYDKVFNFIPPASAKQCSKEAESIDFKAISCVYVHLPEDVVQAIHRIHVNSMSMEQSYVTSRREKGGLLKKFIFELQCQNGNLQEIDAFIKAFTADTEYMDIIKRHYHPIYDFFAGKKTTRSEDDIAELARVIAAHLELHEQPVFS